MEEQHVPSINMKEHLAKTLGLDKARNAEEGKAEGKALRQLVPRESMGSWSWEREDRDPVATVFGQDAVRVPALVPVRHERMAVSPFTFYRGSALLMAQDLVTMPITGVDVQLCGDAHIGNFRLLLSPERRMVWEINDFDETCRGPWEWDIARLCASIEICARDRGFSREETNKAVKAAAHGYREAMRSFANMGNLEMWYQHVDVDDVLHAAIPTVRLGQVEEIDHLVVKARGKDSKLAVQKLTVVKDGHLRVIDAPPLIVPVRDMVAGDEEVYGGERMLGKLTQAVLAAYRSTLSHEKARFLKNYRPVDLARKVVGVGSVGLRAWILVCEGTGVDDPLVLQIKEAQQSVIESVRGSMGYHHAGKRVVEGQRAMQTTGDLLLGWTRMPDAGTGKMRDYYVRQLWDGKGRVDLTAISASSLVVLGEVCGYTLAHAHARTGDRFVIAGYLGKGAAFDKAMLSFSQAYADQVAKDHAAFVEALKKDVGTVEK